MKRIFGGYIKAHGYAIALAALICGTILATNVALVENSELKQVRPLDDYGDNESREQEPTAPPIDAQTNHHYLRMHPFAQMIFPLGLILAGTIFLVGMLFEKKETIFPFGTVFVALWCLVVFQHLKKLERESIYQLILSLDTVVILVIPTYVGSTLAVLYKLFDSNPSDRDDDDEAEVDLETGRKPVKFILGDEFDDSWISRSNY
ncbi:uncharacterized protein LOC129755153 [Uranotaenia lowii]|uniref:uncharacterized protein LOC129755153 n=1 Tax=Uranotaenia lowii TaxID=190385 RepID=UPI00247A3E6F|nr:uncharacterized protein LOC129755153 [Uranotaenia lowii]